MVESSATSLTSFSPAQMTGRTIICLVQTFHAKLRAPEAYWLLGKTKSKLTSFLVLERHLGTDLQTLKQMEDGDFKKLMMKKNTKEMPEYLVSMDSLQSSGEYKRTFKLGKRVIHTEGMDIKPVEVLLGSAKFMMPIALEQEEIIEENDLDTICLLLTPQATKLDFILIPRIFTITKHDGKDTAAALRGRLAQQDPKWESPTVRVSTFTCRESRSLAAHPSQTAHNTLSLLVHTIFTLFWEIAYLRWARYDDPFCQTSLARARGLMNSFLLVAIIEQLKPGGSISAFFVSFVENWWTDHEFTTPMKGFLGDETFERWIKERKQADSDNAQPILPESPPFDTLVLRTCVTRGHPRLVTMFQTLNACNTWMRQSRQSPHIKLVKRGRKKKVRGEDDNASQCSLDTNASEEPDGSISDSDSQASWLNSSQNY
eukprot:gene9222-2993_t